MPRLPFSGGRPSLHEGFSSPKELFGPAWVPVNHTKALIQPLRVVRARAAPLPSRHAGCGQASAPLGTRAPVFAVEQSFVLQVGEAAARPEPQGGEGAWQTPQQPCSLHS